MNSELFDALELLEKTKGIPVDYMLEKIEAALVSAFKKEYGSASVRVDINKDKKEVRVFRRRTVVEEVTDPKTEISLEKAQEISRRYELGSVIEDEIKGKNFGRISALTGKQVIVQGIREAEKNNLNREYEKKKSKSSPRRSQKETTPQATFGSIPALRTCFSRKTNKSPEKSCS